MRFRVLGPLEVRSARDDRRVTPRAAKVRSVLATLLVRSNEVVSVDSLVDELWGQEPPRTAMTTLQVYISQLRKLLRDVAPEFGRDALLTRAPGYLLRVGPGQLDLVAFEELHRRGQEAMEEGQYAAAAGLQRRALDLWRGPLLSDTTHGSLLGTTAVRLDEVRIAALEQRMRAELTLGHHRELLGELQALCAELPLHEEFHAHLMVALYRAGRQADALHAYSRLRRTLVEELAIEPGPRVRRLQRRVLAGDRALLRPGAPRRQAESAERPRPEPPPPPALSLASAGGGLLPDADPLFTGRERELERLTAWLCRPQADCVQITGPAGVGKTALAVAAAHRVRAAFPGGCVLVRLRGGEGRPLDATQVLVQVLRACGAPGPAARSGAELRELLRQLTTHRRRILLILDDVADAAQLRPLQTPGGACTVLATCRPALPGLGGHTLPLDPLTPRDARRLLHSTSGHPHDAPPDHRHAPSTDWPHPDTDRTGETGETGDWSRPGTGRDESGWARPSPGRAGPAGHEGRPTAAPADLPAHRGEPAPERATPADGRGTPSPGRTRPDTRRAEETDSRPRPRTSRNEPTWDQSAPGQAQTADHKGRPTTAPADLPAHRGEPAPERAAPADGRGTPSPGRTRPDTRRAEETDSRPRHRTSRNEPSWDQSAPGRAQTADHRDRPTADPADPADPTGHLDDPGTGRTGRADHGDQSDPAREELDDGGAQFTPGRSEQAARWGEPAPAQGDPADGRGELAEACGRFPGALRALGAHLAVQPHHSPAGLAASLREERTRLGALRVVDEECYRQLCRAYDAAPEADRRAARLLSLLPAGSLSPRAAATVLGIPPQDAGRALNSLVAAGLLGLHQDRRGGQSHRFPVLTRLLATERRTAEGPAGSVQAAVARLCAAARQDLGAPHARADGLPPLDWFARRQDTLVALVGQAHAAGLWDQAVRLADAMSVFLEVSAAWEAWQHTHALALDAAGQSGDRAATVRLLRSLGDLAWQRHRPAAARDLYQRALDATRAGGDDAAAGERGRILAGLADLHLEAGAGDTAARLVLPTLTKTPEDTRGCYEARRVLALHALESRGEDAARPHFQQCLTLAGVLGDRRLEAYARRWLDQLRAGHAARPAWAEVRPGVWCARTAPRPQAPGAGRPSTTGDRRPRECRAAG
ncbi:BTAD domain-containing putative transcriptional regulator [Streptomyces sp. NPDC093510]|uniref:BTAD domain-containing putative transcriptional regulator n=1 Tax=Streptomyces sp. NPDC093510 TaxID=3155199 RepID=UPI00341E4CA8